MCKMMCKAGYKCGRVNGCAKCVPEESPCALVLCQPNQTCSVVAGKAVCAKAAG